MTSPGGWNHLKLVKKQRKNYVTYQNVSLEVAKMLLFRPFLCFTDF